MALGKALSPANQQISLIPKKPGRREAMMLITNRQIQVRVSNQW